MNGSFICLFIYFGGMYLNLELYAPHVEDLILLQLSFDLLILPLVPEDGFIVGDIYLISLVIKEIQS